MGAQNACVPGAVGSGAGVFLCAWGVGGGGIVPARSISAWGVRKQTMLVTGMLGGTQLMALMEIWRGQRWAPTQSAHLANLAASSQRH